MCEPPCRNFRTLHTFNTEFNADSVEWCPHEPHQNLFVCANYQLKENGERFGRILLFSASTEELKLIQTIETAAVLDQKWCHCKTNKSLLGVVNALKTVEIYALDPDLVKLERVAEYSIVDDENETLLLSLDWSTGKFQSNEPHIVCSDSKGKTHRFALRNQQLEKLETFDGHEFEAWIAAFYYWDPNIFFSGADDCTFLKFDCRVGKEAIFRNKSHEAGVTSIHSNSNREHVLATGSYDTFIRLWDIRFLKNSVSSLKMPGTLWRLKWDPFQHSFLLAACMLGGVHIVNVDQSEIVNSYYEHKNIAYGADWSHSQMEEKCLIATCSFYDNLLCISEAELGLC